MLEVRLGFLQFWSWLANLPNFCGVPEGLCAVVSSRKIVRFLLNAIHSSVFSEDFPLVTELKIPRSRTLDFFHGSVQNYALAVRGLFLIS